MNPSSMLFAAALTLEHGLGQPAAAETLAGAVSAALVNEPARLRRPRLDAGVHEPRPQRLPADMRNAEFCRSRMKMNGADAILRSLEAEGVDVAFGLPGGAILPLYDAFARGTTVRHVLARHEQGAGHMAQGYARASGRVGVAIATSGPGATNLVTPIADAWMDSTPLVCITGQVRSNLIGSDAFQECDITGITIPIVKHSWLVQDVEELPHVLKAAFHVARTGTLRARARRRPARHPGSGIRLLVPRHGFPPGMEAAPPRSRAADSGCRSGRSPRRSGPSSTSAAACSTPTRRRSCARSPRRRACPSSRR